MPWKKFGPNLENIFRLVANLVGTSFLFYACALGPSEKTDQERELNTRIAASSISYILAKIPEWANYSLEGTCKRHQKTEFFDFPSLQKSFGLSYQQMVVFQIRYNESLLREMSEEELEFLALETKDKIFFEILGEIQAFGDRPILSSDYPRLSLIALDTLLRSPKDLHALQKNREIFKKGIPVYYSLCLSREEMKKFLSKAKLEFHPQDLFPVSSASIFLKKEIEKEKEKENFSIILDLEALFHGRELHHILK